LKLGRVLATVLALAIGWTATADAAKRVALVIGNNDYATLPNLANARTDAKGMATKLRGLGFDVILKQDASRRNLARALADFENRAANAEVGLVFYAGHGIQVGGKNYLVPANAEIEVEDDLRFEGIGADEFLRAMERAGTKLNIVILDACRDNPLPRRSRSAARGLAVPVVPAGIKGTAIVYSAAPGQTAQDGPKGGHGVFTGALLKVLDEPGLRLEDVFKKTAVRVSRATNGKQDPWINSSVKGDFYFRSIDVNARKKATPAAPTTGGTSAEVAFWQSIQASGDRDMFEAYLKRYPNGAFADLARLKIKKLKPAKPAPTASPAKKRRQPTAADQESLFWQSIKDSDNPADFQDYLVAFPKGTFARLAKRRVRELTRKKIAVARPPTSARSSRREKLRGYKIWVQTKNKSLGLKYCRLLSEAGLIVQCHAGQYRGSGNDIFLKCSTLPSDTGEIVQEILGIRNFHVYDWRKSKSWGAPYCNKPGAIHIWTLD